MSKLLDKIRKFNRILQKAGRLSVDEILTALLEEVDANIYAVNRDGEILACKQGDCQSCEVQSGNPGKLPGEYADWLWRLADTQLNIYPSNNNCLFMQSADCRQPDKILLIVPVYGDGVRLATLLLARSLRGFSDDDCILAEVAATIIGREMVGEQAGINEEAARMRATVRMAMSVLSFSEQEALRHMIAETVNGEGLVVASKISEKEGVTRSVIVNALRKLESAGLIEAKSLGRKGTWIRVTNGYLMEMLEGNGGRMV
ncbi:MAG: GTP-sensing pleiotropic transcriptional regulator CodY [Negativicutes bacterium]|nr:GTP-sensing pleiotropic transcriptional regulator CodY [Negativicutes bacterium]